MPTVKPTEYKAYVGEIKSFDDGKWEIGGLLNATNNIDYGDDRTMSGAFKRTINSAYQVKKAESNDYLWPYLWNHDYDGLPVGGIYDAEETKDGLYTLTRFNPDTQMGRETYASFKAGMLKKQSMGYKAIQYEYVTEGKRMVRNLIEVQVVEGSAVNFPMNDRAIVDVVKSAKARKDFNDHYEDELASDVLEDLWDVYCALTQAFRDAFSIGDQPMDDMKASLSQFTTAMLAMTQRGIDVNLSQYLSDQQSSNSYYGMMGASTMPDFKHYLSLALHSKGGGMSTAKKDAIQAHINTLHTTADKVQEQSKAMKGHSSALHTAADDLATVLQGSEPAYTSDPGQSEDGKEPKSDPRVNALSRKDSHSSKDTDDLAAAFSRLDALTIK